MCDGCTHVLIKLLNQLKNKTHISWMWKNIIKKKKKKKPTQNSTKGHGELEMVIASPYTRFLVKPQSLTQHYPATFVYDFINYTTNCWNISLIKNLYE